MTVDGQVIADVVYGMCVLLAVWMGAMGYRESQIDATERARQAEPWESTCTVTAADLELEQVAEEAEQQLREAEAREQHWRQVAAAPPEFIIQESP